MRYLGGKSRLAKKIRDEILSRADGRGTYWEPFVGGGATFSAIAPAFPKSIASDAHEDLILMWQAVAEGWIPPEHVSKDYYTTLRAAEPSALRGFVGFGCSFGGKWFGGYGWDRGAPVGEESYRCVLKQAPAFAQATIERAPYGARAPDQNFVIYCDPPYTNTTRYSRVGEFDHKAFWHTARDWAGTGALVLVSEYAAPDDFVPVAEFKRLATLKADDNSSLVTEALFIHESQINVKRAMPA